MLTFVPIKKNRMQGNIKQVLKIETPCRVGSHSILHANSLPT